MSHAIILALILVIVGGTSPVLSFILARGAHNRLVLLLNLLVGFLLDRACHAFTFIRVKVRGLGLLFLLYDTEFIDPRCISTGATILFYD